MKGTQEKYHEQQKQRYTEQLDTQKPCERGDTVVVNQISGVPWDEYYPMEGTVISVTPRQMTNGRLGCDWLIRVRFTADGCNGAVYNGTTELFAIGGRRHSWEDAPISLLDP